MSVSLIGMLADYGALGILSCTLPHQKVSQALPLQLKVCIMKSFIEMRSFEVIHLPM